MTEQTNQPGVLVLDGRDIPNPEDMAMLQALYSRSYAPVREHLSQVEKRGSSTFMGRYYVNYGHRSIGDNGHATAFIENVSMLCAKAIQDNQLYNGQECSTRYLDFSKQPFILPKEVDIPVHRAIVEEWRVIYLKALPMLHEWAKRTFSVEDVVSAKIPADKQQETWVNTTKAIAFDVARSLLPCGASTSVAWTTNFSTAGDHLQNMACHPLSEVRDIAQVTHAAFLEKEPNSFRALKPFELKEVLMEDFYYTPRDHSLYTAVDETTLMDVSDGLIKASALKKSYKRRSKVDNSSLFVVTGGLDFGSYRDLQRHRNGYMAMPMVTGQYGFHQWYAQRIMEACGPDLMLEIKALLTEVDRLNMTSLERQYFYPMGMRVPVRMHWNTGQMRYVLDLRSKTSVHPTLREFAWDIWDYLEESLSSFTEHGYFTVDRSPHYFASDRGNQTITEKPQNPVN